MSQIEQLVTVLRHKQREYSALPELERRQFIKAELGGQLKHLAAADRERVLAGLVTAFPTGLRDEDDFVPANVPKLASLTEFPTENLVTELKSRLTRLPTSEIAKIAETLLPHPPRSMGHGEIKISQFQDALEALGKRSLGGKDKYDPLLNSSEDLEKGHPTTEKHIVDILRRRLEPLNDRDLSFEVLMHLAAVLLVEVRGLEDLAKRVIEELDPTAFRPAFGLFPLEELPTSVQLLERTLAGKDVIEPVDYLRASTGLVKGILAWYNQFGQHINDITEALDPDAIEKEAGRKKTDIWGKSSLDYEVLWKVFRGRYESALSELAGRPLSANGPEVKVEVNRAEAMRLASFVADKYGWPLNM